MGRYQGVVEMVSYEFPNEGVIFSLCFSLIFALCIMENLLKSENNYTIFDFWILNSYFCAKLIMMIQKFFGTRERDLFFDETYWVSHHIQKNYSLSLDLGRIKVGKGTRFTLYMLQGQKYIHHSEGSEAVVGDRILYYSQFPFAGKVKVRG